MYSRLLDVTSFVYADKILVLHFSGGVMSTVVTPSAVTPLVIALLTVYVIRLLLSLNHNVEPTEYTV